MCMFDLFRHSRFFILLDKLDKFEKKSAMHELEISDYGGKYMGGNNTNYSLVLLV